MDHYVRFIVTAVLDNLLKGLWFKDELEGRNSGVPKAVYAVLIYLWATLMDRVMKSSRNPKQIL